ncbi:MAG: hypothetical protein ACREQB_07845, partial [Candidatus Binataceae bacterium]
GGALMAMLVALAVWRGGLLDLPAAPRDVTADQAGLANLPELADRARTLESLVNGQSVAAAPSDSAFTRAVAGLAAIRRGDAAQGLALLRSGVTLAPADLVLGNAFRMAAFQLRRAHLTDARGRETLVARIPSWLEREPIATLERLHASHPQRETALQLALAWVDELILFPALEIKAPASVESVNLLSELLQREPAYVPALYGRGLNYLHRPSRLEWPEARKAAPDAASRDLGLAVAIGRRIGGGSPELVATLALTLGDALAKEGKADRARSWWQIAANTHREPALVDATRRRFAWRDDEMLDRLEAELEGRMADLDHPLTDLSIMWR